MWRSERIEQPKNLNHNRDFDLIIFNLNAGFLNQNTDRLRYSQRDREIEEQRDRERADNKSSKQTTG